MFALLFDVFKMYNVFFIADFTVFSLFFVRFCVSAEDFVSAVFDVKLLHLKSHDVGCLTRYFLRISVR